MPQTSPITGSFSRETQRRDSPAFRGARRVGAALFVGLIASLRMMAVSGLGWMVSCSPDSEKLPPREEPAAPPATGPQGFSVKGVVVEVSPAEQTVRIKHDEIPGYMRAMTMDFEVRDTNELRGVEAGHHVAFRMWVTDDDGWIDQIHQLPRPATNTLPTTGQFRFVRDVEPLEVGDALPEYRFTNQLGRAFSTADFLGRALAISFIYTRCPFPTFCPRTMSRLAETQRLLSESLGGATNWHLLALSFDPEFDTPALLRSFGAGHGQDPRCWTLATGALIDVTAVAEQLGLEFWREQDGGISHNLRTAVFDPEGRLWKVFVGNKWRAEELAAELLEAMKHES